MDTDTVEVCFRAPGHKADVEGKFVAGAVVVFSSTIEREGKTIPTGGKSALYCPAGMAADYLPRSLMQTILINATRMSSPEVAVKMAVRCLLSTIQGLEETLQAAGIDFQVGSVFVKGPPEKDPIHD